MHTMSYVAISLALTFGNGCWLPALAQPDTVQGPDYYRTYRAVGDNCTRLQEVENRNKYTENMQLARDIDAHSEVDTAFAGVPLVPEHQDGRWMGFTTGAMAGNYARCLAKARGYIGDYYFFGLGIPQNYGEAAKWYMKSIKTKLIEGYDVSGYSSWKVNLGLLYAYGMGVPQDRARARQLWTETDDRTAYDLKGSVLTRLMDNNALPKVMGERGNFTRAVAAANAEVKAADAQLTEEANRQRQRRQEADEARRYADAARTATTVVCTATSPPAFRGSRTTFLLDLPKHRLVGRKGDGDFMDLYMSGSHEHDLPLTISDNAISWKGDSNLTATLNRTALELDWENSTFRFQLDCRVAEKQL